MISFTYKIQYQTKLSNKKIKYIQLQTNFLIYNKIS